MYINVFVWKGASHLMPKYVPNNIIIRKIFYLTIVVGFTTLSNSSKKTWPRFLIRVG